MPGSAHVEIPPSPDALPDVVFAADAAGRLTYLSGAWPELTGSPVADALGTRLGDHLDPAPSLAREVRAEVRCATAFGTARWVELRARPDGDGSCGTLCDITERRREAARLADAEARFRGAFDHAAAGMAILSADGRILRVNAALCELAGRGAEDLLELAPRDLTHADDLPVEAVHWERMLHGQVRDFELEKRLVRPDGEVVWTRQCVALVRAEDGEPLYAVAQLWDVTAARRAAERLARRALHDAVTGLPNRTLFLDRLALALARTRRSGRRVGVLRCTLGDALERAAVRLEPVLRPGDTVARIGEDELAILLEGLRDEDEAAIVARRVEAALTGLGARIGVAMAAEGEAAPERVVAAATARADGPEEGRLRADLRRALELGELRLAFQPVVALGDGRITGLEALLRWDDPRHGERLPGEFLPAAEDAGLVTAFGEWVLREACRRLGAWRADGLARDVCLTVNLSGAELRRPDLADVVADALREGGVPASALRLEVSEDAAAPATLGALRALARLGVTLAIDDFGSGATSFTHVTRVPALREIKVDRALVQGVATSREDAAIVAAVISFGRSLGVAVVAEGLENLVQVRLLRELGCTLGQGFWFGRPLPGAELEQLLRRAEFGELGI